MFRVSRSIVIGSGTTEQTFAKISERIEGLTERWQLISPQIKKNQDELFIDIHSKRFQGKVVIDPGELTIEGEFQDLFKFNKRETEKQLDLWLQEIFGSVYDM